MLLKSSRLGPWTTLLVAGTAQFLVLLESTIITVAIPSMGADLGDGGWLAWVLSGYLLAFGALLLPGGIWADRRGQRPVFFTGLVSFAVSSVLCALSPGIEVLVATRMLQGASAGVLAASALGVVLTRYVGSRERAVAMTVWSALGVIGAVAGSLCAGPLIMWLGWPGVFWINVAAVAILLPVAWRVIESRRGAAVSPRVWPAFVAATGTAGILAGLSIAERTVAPGTAVALLGIAVVVGTVLAQRRSAAPILPVGLFRLPSYRAATTGLFAGNGLMIASMFACSSHLQGEYGLSAAAASLAILPVALAALVVAFLADLLIGCFTETVTFRLAGVVLIAGAGVLLWVSLTEAAWGWLIVGGALIGAGLPACFVILNRTAYAQVESSQAGSASGFTNMLTTIGGAVTVALTALAGTLLGRPGAYGVLLASALFIATLRREPSHQSAVGRPTSARRRAVCWRARSARPVRS
ncbi:MFS transporter [Streptomyces sp. NPDC052042]|uniref:MFS transporter n=1 Tax=Streptomyces sp. NPDC052042 TaxID=3365683 RepID=UPI0037D685A2